MSTRNEISAYFSKNISGFVANKFIVEISGINFSPLRFYVKKISMPFETINLSEDIYVSESTLAKPKNVLSVNTTSELSLTLRMDSDNQIIKALESLYRSTHNISKFEASGRPTLVNISIRVYGDNYSEKYSKLYTNCILVKMESYDVDSSDRKLKEYSTSFICNNIGPNEYTSTDASARVARVVNCQQLLDEYRNAVNIYKVELNKTNQGNISIEYMQGALSVSNIIQKYINLLNNSAKCEFNEKFVIGFDIPPNTRQYLKSVLSRNGVPDNMIDYSNS